MTTVEGKAIDVKAGGILMLEDGGLIYIDDLEYWPDEAVGKRVSVSGWLVEKEYVPRSKVDENGAISQGVSGADLDTVIENPEWKIVE